MQIRPRGQESPATYSLDDLLALARLSRASMRFSNLDISSIVTSIVGALRKAEPARVVELQTIEGLKATADAGLLRIALENLLGNAWKLNAKAARLFRPRR